MRFHPEVLLVGGYAVVLLVIAAVLDVLAQHTAQRSERFRTAGFRYLRQHDAWTCSQDEMLWPMEYDKDHHLVPLGSFGESLAAKATKKLEQLGVEVQLGVMVVDVDEYGLQVRDPDGTIRRIESRTKVWAAGVAASPLAKHLADQAGLQVDHAGRVPVADDCSLPGFPEVFVIGDMMDAGVPGVAQAAMQSGKYAAAVIAARVAGQDAREVSDTWTKAAWRRSRGLLRWPASAGSGSPDSSPG